MPPQRPDPLQSFRSVISVSFISQASVASVSRQAEESRVSVQRVASRVSEASVAEQSELSVISTHSVFSPRPTSAPPINLSTPIPTLTPTLPATISRPVPTITPPSTPILPSTTASFSRIVPTPPPSRSLPLTQRTSSAVSPSPSDVNANTSKAGGASKSGLSGVAIGLIVAAAVVAIIIIGGFVARKYFQARRRARRNTWGAGAIGASPFGNEDKPVVDNYVAASAPARPRDSSYGQYDGAQAQYGGAGAPNMYGGPPVSVPFPGYGNQNNGMPPQSQQPMYYPPGPLLDAHGHMQGSHQPDMRTLTPSPVPEDAPFFASGAVADPRAATPSRSPEPSNLGNQSLFVANPTAAIGSGIALRAFDPSLPDELQLVLGQRVQVLQVYDDGWALCEDADGRKGMCPLECLQTDVVAPSS